MIYRARIIGSYQDKPFVGEGWAGIGDKLDEEARHNAEYWWSEGNGGCDCNRIEYTGLTAETAPELFHLAGQPYEDGSMCEETHVRCGSSICLDRIEPIDNPSIPTIKLGLKLL